MRLVCVNDSPIPDDEAAGLVGIPNVTVLRAFPGAPNEVVALLGYTTANDGGQGMFQWMTTNGIDDGGTRFNAGGLGSNMPGWARI